MTYVLPVYNRTDLMFDRGKGVYLYTKNGTRYLDFAAGIAVNSLGHCHPHVVKALKTQGEKLWHVSNMYQVEGLEELAERICKASKFADKAFFCNSGAEAVECGLKMIRRYHWGEGNPNRYRVITFEGCFHGRTLATISAAKKPKVMEGYEPAMDGFDQAPFEDLAATEALITEQTAGILIEPVQGEGGIRPASKAFLQGLRDLCDKHGLLLMFDGIQCGMGRTGKFFSHEWCDVYPDITSSAKGIATGFPFGACLATDRAAKHMTFGTHGSTYGNNPLGVAVSNAVMDIMLADGFLEGVAAIGDYLRNELEKLKNDFHDVVETIRGVGLMQGVKLNEAHDAREVVQSLREKRFLSVPAGDNVVRLLPPLIITETHVDEAIAILKTQLEELHGSN